MNSIDLLYQEDGSRDSFIYDHAIKLFSFVGKEPELCYWLISCLEPAYEGECMHSLIPIWNDELDTKEMIRLFNNAVSKVMQSTLEILSLCSGNLLNPILGKLLIKNDIDFEDKQFLGSGAYGFVYLVDGFAVKTVPYIELEPEVNSLIRELVALSMLNRLKFIGINEQHFYIGMEYYPENLSITESHKEDLINELILLRSLGVIHCDIKPNNIRIDSEGHCRLIDFGSCRFKPSSGPNGFMVTNDFCDYLLFKDKEMVHSFEIDIWSLGIVFYMLEKKTGPWTLSGGKEDYAKCIENSYCTAMEDVSPLVKSMLALTKEDRWKIL